MTFHDAMEAVVIAFEVAGVAVLSLGALVALVRAVGGSRRHELGVYQRARQDVGKAILIGLEILIIADIVQTVTIDATVESALTLGLIVLVRTFLSFSLEIELEGVVPWHRRRATTATATASEPTEG
jgi:uncharacterized membrane protein